MLNWIVSSSVLILAVLGLRILFRGRISQRMTYALWALVLLRLLIPGSILSSAASVANLVSEFTAPPVFSAPVLEQEEALEQVLTEHQITHTDFDALPVPQQNAYTQQADALVESSRVEAQAEIQKQETRYYSIRQILVAVWLLGAVLTAGCLLWANFRFARALSRSRRKEDERLYRSAAAESPCLFGLFRPAIYLPEDLPEGDVPYVLAHEKTHLRHLDHIWSVLRCLCLAAHWFNPLVWIAVKASRTDSELACDEGALEYLGDESREDYGLTLIRMSRGKNRNLLLTATTMTGDKRTLYARVKAIARKPRILAAAVVLLALTAAIAVGCTFTGPEASADPTEPPETIGSTEPPETTEPVTTEPIMENDPFLMRNALDSQFELDYKNRYIMALGNVEVKGVPSPSAETIDDLHYEFVRIQAATYRDEGKWVLVSYDISDGFGNMGWVRLSDLVEYTEETRELLRYPVSLSDFCRDVDTGKKLLKGRWVLLSVEGEYATITTKVSGRNNRVKLSDIVYPELIRPAAPPVPTASSLFAEHILIQEPDLSSYKMTSDENWVAAQEQYNGYRVDHIHLGTGASGSVMPYDYGHFWASAASGDGYERLTIENGNLEKVEGEPASLEGTLSQISVSFQSDGNIACFVDPFDGETVYVQLPEGWESRTDEHWYRSYDGRMLYSAMNGNRDIFELLVFDGRTNRLYQIKRADKPNRFQENIDWSHDNRLVLYSNDTKEISVYTFGE